MTVIAIEEHWTTAALAAALDGLPESSRDDSLALNDRGDNQVRLQDVGEGRLATMDGQGIDMHILSVVTPGTGPLDARRAMAFSRQLNDLAAEAVRRNSTRLRALATLPMTAPGKVPGELERAASLGCVGAMVYGRTGECALDDPCYDELFAVAASLDQPLFIHPQIPARSTRQALYAGFDPMTELALSTFGWGWHVEAAVAALRLIVRGTFDRHPDLKIVLGHWGELLLFWRDRIDGISGIAGLERRVSDYLRTNVFITSSGMLDPVLLHHALAATDVDHLLFSTDYPFHRPDQTRIQQFLAEFHSDADQQAFTGGNARRLFGLDRPVDEASRPQATS